MTKKEEQRMALTLFNEPCTGKNDRYHGGNCQHCCLRGEGLPNTADGKGKAPNYAGWARLYVQAGRTIPARFALEFIKELEREDNPAYVNALKEDIEYFGVTIEGVEK